ncbi:guanitoxin biosynthesis heme-dependent pre-guanitoxin N-hydroxylase GntA [Mycobacterium sp.]|uniref:guanitoxin biosynthesis heme-dependent pre-guanitoxin N-hydroxylase GntA n=1 Tax=Mycobacterium sp. TaxID=1785 RepID=UPI002CC5FBAD|nr:guanitoxin biosynthesis heme-dependent pre-guanitoxin N-hydroxylase GntA [Mycobacterium sp.]HTY31686.1 guanitoxin biosynthesis heme-dependent pre-guanitoxin N-hydroxylase GntA [Mycobacterium sp.]
MGRAREEDPVMPTIAEPNVDLGRHRGWNPLAADPVATAGSSYLGSRNGALECILEPPRPPNPAEVAVHDHLREWVLGEGYPCVGARSAFNRRLYRFGLYPELGAGTVARALCHDLYEFAYEMGSLETVFVTFIAVFSRPKAMSEVEFERLMWVQLQTMHDIDGKYFPWDPEVSCDPENERFSFSIGARAYFVVGMHHLASRKARQFPYATLVFNLHEQFERMRERGKFEMFRDMIRARDVAFSGSINPVLTNFGSSSEARQYSGRAVEDDWRCPFAPSSEKAAE